MLSCKMAGIWLKQNWGGTNKYAPTAAELLVQAFMFCGDENLPAPTTSIGVSW